MRRRRGARSHVLPLPPGGKTVNMLLVEQNALLRRLAGPAPRPAEEPGQPVEVVAAPTDEQLRLRGKSEAARRAAEDALAAWLRRHHERKGGRRG